MGGARGAGRRSPAPQGGVPPGDTLEGERQDPTWEGERRGPAWEGERQDPAWEGDRPDPAWETDLFYVLRENEPETRREKLVLGFKRELT
eukprot:365299-Chlamydomonas_euryale.AAC.10